MCGNVKKNKKNSFRSTNLYNFAREITIHDL